ncbi:MAG: tripartite tricarboxylate transporter substrate binding protein [Lachnospiraceae bacterium]|nr:tripartite tricarboxylate transporter substrate binding protein [Lachnospiraceae bacterium]
MKKWIGILLSVALIATMLAGCSSSSSSSTDTTAAAAETEEATTGAADSETEEETTEAAASTTTDYPTKTVTAVVPFGTTSGTDAMSRTLCTLAQEFLGQTITVINKTGASAAVGTTYVSQQAADGYTLLTGSESTGLFRCWGTADLDYDDFIPILLYMRECGIMITYADSPYETVEDLIEAARENPGKITVGTTGTGGLPDVWWSILEYEFDVEFNRVAYDGSSDANTALLGKHIEAFVAGTQTSYPLMTDGSVRVLAVMDNEAELDGYEDCPRLTDYYPDLAEYMPYGPFFVVEVAAGTDQAIVDTLTDAFMQAYETDEFQEYIGTCRDIPMGLTGDEANEFMKNQQAKIWWLMYDIGETEVCPSDYGVERLEE